MSNWTEIEFYITAEDGQDVEREFYCKALVHPGSPGKTWGDPESCYPPEPEEVDDVRVYRDEKYTQPVPESEFVTLGIDFDRLVEKAVEAAGEYWDEMAQDYDERERD